MRGVNADSMAGKVHCHRFSDVLDFQRPHKVLFVGDGDTWDTCDHVTANGHDHLTIDVNECHLKIAMVELDGKQMITLLAF